MKYVEYCNEDCLFCGAKDCNLENPEGRFARANKEELIEKLHNDNYSDYDKHRIIVWLKVQVDYKE